jgi:hypothetical protein
MLLKQLETDTKVINKVVELSAIILPSGFLPQFNFKPLDWELPHGDSLVDHVLILAWGRGRRA